MSTTAERDQAVAKLIGALCYALLRSFEVTARATATAPSVELAETEARFAVEEYDRFEALRAHLVRLSSDPHPAMEAYRPALDEYYAKADLAGWLETQVFHLIGDTVTADFAELLAPALDAETGDAVRRALTGRTEQQAFAIQQIGEALEADGAGAQARIARYAGTMVGESLNTLRGALEASDSLEVVLGEGGVKEVVLEVLGRHRERLERLGIEAVDA